MHEARIEPSWAQNTTLLLGAQVFRNLGPIAVLLLLARVTDQTTVGQYSLALAVATPFFVFAQFGLRTVTLTLKPAVPFISYLTLQSITALLALIAATVFAMFGTPAILLAVLLVGILKISDAFADLFSGTLQKNGQANRVFWGSAITSVITVLSVAVALIFARELLPALLALALASTAATYMFMYLPARQVNASSSHLVAAPGRLHQPSATKRIITAGLPLGAATAILTLISTVPQYLITLSYDPAATARFAVLLYIYALADIVSGTTAQAWIPVAQRHNDSSRNQSALVRIAARNALKWAIIYIPITVCGLWAASYLIPFVFGYKYVLSFAEAIPLGLAIIMLPVAHFFSTSVSIRNYYSHTLTIAISSAAVSILLAFCLIPQLGLAGAFWALFSSVCVRAITACIVLLQGIFFTRRSTIGKN